MLKTFNRFENKVCFENYNLMRRLLDLCLVSNLVIGSRLYVPL